MKLVRTFILCLAMLLVAAGALVAEGSKEELGSEENPIIWSFVPSGEMERVAGGAQ